MLMLIHNHVEEVKALKKVNQNLIDQCHDKQTEILILKRTLTELKSVLREQYKINALTHTEADAGDYVVRDGFVYKVLKVESGYTLNCSLVNGKIQTPDILLEWIKTNNKTKPLTLQELREYMSFRGFN